MKVKIFDQIRQCGIYLNLCMSFTGIDCSYSMCFMCKRKVAHNMRLTYCTLQNSKMLIRAILKRTTLSNHVFKQLTIGAGRITFCHNNAFILKMQDPKKNPTLSLFKEDKILTSALFTQRCCWFLENFYFVILGIQRLLYQWWSIRYWVLKPPSVYPEALRRWSVD